MFRLAAGEVGGEGCVISGAGTGTVCSAGDEETSEVDDGASSGVGVRMEEGLPLPFFTAGVSDPDVGSFNISVSCPSSLVGSTSCFLPFPFLAAGAVDGCPTSSFGGAALGTGAFLFGAIITMSIGTYLERATAQNNHFVGPY